MQINCFAIQWFEIINVQFFIIIIVCDTILRMYVYTHVCMCIHRHRYIAFVKEYKLMLFCPSQESEYISVSKKPVKKRVQVCF